MTKIVRILLILTILILSMISTHAQDAGCGLESQLQAGIRAVVLPGDPNNVRTEPGTNGELVGQLEAGRVFMALGEPVCAEGFTWAEVVYTDQYELITGWTAESDSSEYFVEPLAGEVITVEGMSIVLPEAVGTAAEGIVHEVESPTDDEPWRNSPAYTEFTITAGYPDEDYREYDTPSIQIYAADAFEDRDGIVAWTGQDTIDGLPDILNDYPDLATFSPSGDYLPTFSPGSGPSMFAFLGYLDFQNGSGYRFITYYAQNTVGPTNTMLVYSFFGLTTDGQYFVSAKFPVEAPALPEPFDPSDSTAAFQEYSDSIVEFFEAFDTAAYAPNLGQLDVLVASLHIETVETEE